MSKTWDVYAYIQEGRVIDIKPFSTNGYRKAISFAKYDFAEEAIVVDVTNIGVERGDFYRDGVFYYVSPEGDEYKREPVPSEEDRIEAVETTSATNTTSIDANTTAIDDILVMLLDDTSATDDLSGLEDTTDTDATT